LNKPEMEEDINGMVPVLSISSSHEDHELLDMILNGSEANWDVVRTDTLPSALSLLRDRWFPIVICERDLEGGAWQTVLEERGVMAPASVIVTSRFADERLWAEALNLGAYDVLAKPFDRHEVYRVVDSAWRHWANSRGKGGLEVTSGPSAGRQGRGCRGDSRICGIVTGYSHRSSRT
jgi:DNA-binding NtrC family response regulator